MITIVNYGLGNLGSIQNMLKRLGYDSEITSKESEILKADKLILPGVGKFDAAMHKIEELKLKEALDYKAKQEKIPVLGICLGMQLLANSSEEGIMPGFGWIDAEVIKFNFQDNHMLKIPHMGWNEVKIINPCALTKGMTDDFRYYFVHSYYVKTKNRENSFLTCDYGLTFDAAIYQDNIYGVQFHPEKSHRFGKVLLKNFADL